MTQAFPARIAALTALASGSTNRPPPPPRLCAAAKPSIHAGGWGSGRSLAPPIVSPRCDTASSSAPVGGRAVAVDCASPAGAVPVAALAAVVVVGKGRVAAVVVVGGVVPAGVAGGPTCSAQAASATVDAMARTQVRGARAERIAEA